jgi:hypothetical protein
MNKIYIHTHLLAAPNRVGGELGNDACSAIICIEFLDNGGDEGVLKKRLGAAPGKRILAQALRKKVTEVRRPLLLF